MAYFGTDGIRAKAEFFSERFLAQFCSALYLKYGACKIVLGRDTRVSGESISNYLKDMLCAYGFNVFFAGIVPTGTLAFLTRTYCCDLGVMVTASHNPSDYNGLKLFNARGAKISKQEESEIENLFLAPIAPKKAFKNDREIGIESYVQYVKGIVGEKLRELNVVLDCAYGATSFIAERIFKECGAVVDVLNGDANGIKINENCGATHITALIKYLEGKKYDVAFSYDGDGDRVIAVKEGKVINGDGILYVLSRYLQLNGSMKPYRVIGTVTSNLGLEKALENNGITLIRSDVGDLNVYEKMCTNHVVLGGESSGHVILKDYGETGDGIITSIMLSLVEKEMGINALFDMLEYPSIEENLTVTKEERAFIVDSGLCLKVVDEFSSSGLRVVVRLSGTEEKLRILVEGEVYERVLETLAKIKMFVLGKLHNIDIKDTKIDKKVTQNDKLLNNEFKKDYTVIDETLTFLDKDVIIESGAVIHPFTVIKGKSVIGKNAVIYPFCDLTDTVVGDGATVRSSYALGAIIGARTSVGPFATLRKDAVIGEDCRIGDYVEIKNATLGNGVKAAHLSYVGDAVIGEKTNVGCGTVFANFNGKVKRRSEVGERVFIGCNANVIAPVTIGNDVFIAGGTTVTENVPDGHFAIARIEQINLPRKST